jgi:hypothetical protein
MRVQRGGEQVVAFGSSVEGDGAVVLYSHHGLEKTNVGVDYREASVLSGQ